jgi:cellobiose transport system substrate-binding protein
VCYRTDLFEQAGLPTARDEVSALWPTWEDYVDVGNQFTQKLPKVTWFDAGGHLFTGIIGNEEETYYNADGELIVEDNEVVRDAWDLTVGAIEDGQSAALPEFSPEWNTGFQQGQFATITCPAWMMGYIQANAAETSGKWDIATIPGGGGNWGGSWWTIPKQSANADEAYKFVEWMVQPAQQIEVFKTVGNLPSQPELYKDPAVLDYKKEFMSNAPTGQIFAATAENLKPQYLGKKNGPTRVAVENVIKRVQEGSLKSGAAWPEAIKAAEKAANS